MGLYALNIYAFYVLVVGGEHEQGVLWIFFNWRIYVTAKYMAAAMFLFFKKTYGHSWCMGSQTGNYADNDLLNSNIISEILTMCVG